MMWRTNWGKGGRWCLWVCMPVCGRRHRPPGGSIGSILHGNGFRVKRIREWHSRRVIGSLVCCRWPRFALLLAHTSSKSGYAGKRTTAAGGMTLLWLNERTIMHPRQRAPASQGRPDRSAEGHTSVGDAAHQPLAWPGGPWDRSGWRPVPLRRRMGQLGSVAAACNPAVVRRLTRPALVWPPKTAPSS